MSLRLPSGAVLNDTQLAHAGAVVAAARAEMAGDTYTHRAIAACLACCLVESGLTMYANSNVAASMGHPHEQVGSDHASVGLYQQQVPSWGTVDQCMDPKQSTLLFLGRGGGRQPGLTSLPRYRFSYVGQSQAQHWFDMPVGSAVQAVQVSAFPTRYAERLADAEAIIAHFAAPPPPEDDMTPDQVQQIVNASLREFAFGTTGPRGKTNPFIAPDPDNGVFDRLNRITSGLSSIAKQLKAQGVDINGLDKDVASLQTQINQVKAEVKP